jgi:hypothetical protein
VGFNDLDGDPDSAACPSSFFPAQAVDSGKGDCLIGQGIDDGTEGFQ